jgi:hypothetical protein
MGSALDDTYLDLVAATLRRHDGDLAKLPPGVEVADGAE